MAEQSDRKEFEIRVDFIDNQDLLDWTVENEQFQQIQEKLFEKGAIASKENIKESIKNFLGINLQKSEDPDLDKILEDFSKVCQIRHCLVHRFGLLGSIKDKFKKYFDVFAADESRVSIKDAYENFKRAHAGTPIQ